MPLEERKRMDKMKPNFICPSCGSSSLYLKGEFTYKLNFPINQVDWEPVIHSNLIDLNIEDRYLQDVKDALCYCKDCGFVVASQKDCAGGDYAYLGDDLVNWLGPRNMLQSEEEEGTK